MKTNGRLPSLYKISLFVLYLFGVGIIFISSPKASEWKAGLSTAVVTPEEPLWMGGYGARAKPSEGKIHDLYVKALALEGPEGNRVVIVTADILGVPIDFTNSVYQEIHKRYGLPREALLLNTSHTHCGPAIPLFKLSLYNMSEDDKKKVDGYVHWLEMKYIEVISDALGNMKTVVLSFSSGNPTPFAVSRRYPTPEGIVYRSGPSTYYTGGPRDDIVPVLKIADTVGNIKAILFGYACHPITLSGYEFCGDYPGFAQQYIEEAYPGATALFIQGCSGQLVPNARFQVEYAMGHGRALADAVKKALDGEQIPINSTLNCAYDEVILDFVPPPDRKVIEENAKSDNESVKSKATYFLDLLNNNKAIETTLPCPLHVIRFGQELLFIGLSGEPVAGYSVKFKSEFLTHKFVWIAGFCDYDFGYLPTWKVLKEGGYEGGELFERATHFPGPFTETVEKRVVDGVHRLVENVSE
ncbi:MAG: hypothetical protein JXB48_21280 [Candidatus Latescibacteria bacterium]|nr:hypothetical protein [Candidatus Latescibacterota bacterium]